MKLFRCVCFCLFLFFLSACAANKDEPVQDNTPVEELYNAASDLMAKGDYKKAAWKFQEVERQHPYSSWAARAQVMAGYAEYQAMDYDAAIAALDQFIQIHPGNESVAYAYFLRALCDYERIADVRRDQSSARRAKESLQTVVRRFPETPYATDAVLKLSLIDDHLAGAEMDVGRNYIDKKLYTAALGRFKGVVEKYQTTSHVPEALHRIVECSLALGMSKEAQTVAAVLGHNFPGSAWYEDSYNLLARSDLSPDKAGKKWLADVWDEIFTR